MNRSKTWPRRAVTLLLFAGWATTGALRGQNLLSDPGFESGTPVASGFGGWDVVVDASFSQAYAHSGHWSMDCYYVSGGFHGVCVQSLAAVPGMQYRLDGWGFTPALLSASSYANLILFFTDANGALLGNYYGSAPILSGSPAATWISLSVGQVAPAGATHVWAETSLFNPGPGDAVYFDDLNLTVVPEPSLFGAVGLGAALVLARRILRTDPSLGI